MNRANSGAMLCRGDSTINIIAVLALLSPDAEECIPLTFATYRPTPASGFLQVRGITKIIGSGEPDNECGVRIYTIASRPGRKRDRSSFVLSPVTEFKHMRHSYGLSRLRCGAPLSNMTVVWLPATLSKIVILLKVYSAVSLRDCLVLAPWPIIIIISFNSGH